MMNIPLNRPRDRRHVPSVIAVIIFVVLVVFDLGIENNDRLYLSKIMSVDQDERQLGSKILCNLFSPVSEILIAPPSNKPLNNTVVSLSGYGRLGNIVQMFSNMITKAELDVCHVELRVDLLNDLLTGWKAKTSRYRNV